MLVLQQNGPSISYEIQSIVEDNRLWDNLKGLLVLMEPFTQVLDLLQSDHARLYNILQQFGRIVPLFITDKPSFVEQLPQDQIDAFISRLERRWYQWEQPLIILASYLNPFVRLDGVNQSPQPVHPTVQSRGLNVRELAEWAGAYYKMWTGEEARTMLEQVMMYEAKYTRSTPRGSTAFRRTLTWPASYIGK